MIKNGYVRRDTHVVNSLHNLFYLLVRDSFIRGLQTLIKAPKGTKMTYCFRNV